MDQRQQPERVAKKRKSEEIESPDDDHDELEDLQERLDRILGSDSSGESDYTPEKSGDLDSQTEEEDDVTGEKDSEKEKGKADDEKEEDDAMSEDSEIEKMKEEQRKRLDGIKKVRALKPTQHGKETLTEVSEKNNDNNLDFDDLRSVPTLVKESLDPLQRNILYLAKKRAEKKFIFAFEKTHVEDIKKHLRRLIVEDPEECCATLIEVMKQPRDLFLSKTKTQHNYETEELGKIALELAQRMLRNNALRMEAVLEIGVCGRGWRNASNKSHSGRGNVRQKGAWRRIPRTMTAAAHALLEGGDIARLTELFEVIMMFIIVLRSEWSYLQTMLK